MNQRDYIKNSKAYIWKETFSVIKSKTIYPQAFANISDKNEITVIIDQTKYNEYDVIEIEKDWKILTFDMVLPFGMKGFLAEVSQALADEDVGILTVSAFSTDHILVKQNDLQKAKQKLESLGCIIDDR